MLMPAFKGLFQVLLGNADLGLLIVISPMRSWGITHKLFSCLRYLKYNFIDITPCLSVHIKCQNLFAIPTFDVGALPCHSCQHNTEFNL